MTRPVLLLLVALVLAAPARAQSVPDGVPPEAPLHLGPLMLKPAIALTNLGVDDNVFNASDVNHPKRDFTLTLTPQTDVWMRTGRLWVVGAVRNDFVYYGRFASERSVNRTYRGTVILPLNRLTIRAGGDYLQTRDRPGYEIDTRSRHTDGGYQGAVEVRTFGRTFVGATLRRERVAFERGEEYLGRSLQLELNRTMTTAGLSLRHGVTPVTDLIVRVDREADRFQFSPVRDSDSTRVAGGLRFNARLIGSAIVGFRAFTPLAADVPAYRGATASVDLTVALLAATRVAVQVTRDLQYSYDAEQPYYLGTGGGFSVTQGLAGPFDVVGRMGREDLAYRGRLGATVAADHADVVHWFGGGLGYRVGRNMRVGFNVDRQHRTSDRAGRGYDGLRYGTSVTYGF